MKLRRNKKGFTMVELIIVIAVIAVLTAILVPTFIHLANKAGDASDKTIVKNANTQLALKAAQGRRNTSMSEAVKDVDEIGYHMSGVSTSNGNQICWDRLNDRFVLFNKDNQIILADGERTQPATAEEFADFFKPVSNFADAGQFTPFAKSDFNFEGSGVTLTEGTLTLGAKSFDVGELEGVTTVNVEDTSATGTYLVGTGNTGVKVNINVPNGTVYHLGIAGEVNITGIKGDSYHEFGRIGFAEMASTGRYVAEKGAEVKALWFSNENAKYTKQSGATVNEYAPDTTIKAKIEAQLTNDDVIVSGDHDGVKSNAIEAITAEINKEEGVEPVNPPVPEHVLSPLDIEKQAEGYVFRVGENYYKSMATCDLLESTDDGYVLGVGIDNVEFYFIGNVTDSTETFAVLGKTLTFDLNGYSILLQKGLIVMGEGNLTIKDSGADNGGVLSAQCVSLMGGNDGMFQVANSTINIQGGSFDASMVNDKMFDGGWGGDSTYNISGGSFKAAANKSIFADKTSTYNITGGTFDATASGSTIFNFTEATKSVDMSKAKIVDGSTVYKS